VAIHRTRIEWRQALEDLLKEYTAAGVISNPTLSFLTEMLTRLKSRNLTPKQTNRAEEILTRGVPQGNLDALKKIEQMLELPDSKRFEKPLRDFQKRLSQLRDLSPRQARYFSRIKDEMDALRHASVIELTDDDLRTLWCCEQFFSMGSAYYWATRPQKRSRLACVFGQFKEEQVIRDIDFQFVKHSFRGKLKRLAFPRFCPGDIAYARSLLDEPGVVLEGPLVGGAQVGFWVLLSGQRIFVDDADLLKRRPRSNL